MMEELRGDLRRNWLYLVTATLIAVFLWVGVSANEVLQRSVPTDLVVITTDPDYVLTQQEPSVQMASVVFTGRAVDLDALSVSRPRILITIDSVSSPMEDVALTPAMVKGRGGTELGDVRPVSVRPEQVRLHFQPRSQKVVPVIPLVRLSLAPGYVRADTVRAEPGAVAVSGPESLVDQIDSVVTNPVTREQLSESISVEVGLEQPDDPDGLVEFSSNRVRVTVPVEPWREQVFRGIPVSVEASGGPGIRLSPAVVDVRISGPESKVMAVRPEALSPRVRISGPADYGRTLQISLPAPGPFLEVVLDPDTTRVIQGEGSG